MLVKHKKTFTVGMSLALTFLVVLAFMFSPSFNGENAFKASDRLFNSISKGSTYYIPELREKAKAYHGAGVELTLNMGGDKFTEQARTVLAAAGMSAEMADGKLKVSGDLGAAMEAALVDSEAMFHNDGAAVQGRYGIEERAVLYTWWKIFKEMDKGLKAQKQFKPAKFLAELVAKGVEVGYNYYGIEPQSASTKMGILSFALVFYVVYTLWWGYAIFYLSDGMGLQMKGGKKKEV